MSPTELFQRILETLRCSIYDFQNEQMPNFHIITPQIPTRKALKLFFLHPIKYNGASKRVAKVKVWF